MSANLIISKSTEHNNIQNGHKIIAWLTGLLTLTLAVFAFVLSFNSLTDLALKHGVSIPPLFPFIVEFAVVIFSLNALHKSLTGQSAKWQWTLIILSSMLAGTFNVAHANSDILSRTMAAMPSLFLLLSFESFLNLVRYSVIRQGTVTTLDNLRTLLSDTQAEFDKMITDKQAQLGRLDRQIEVKSVTDAPNVQTLDKANDTRQEVIEKRRQQVLSYLAEDMTEDDMADKLNVSIRTIKRDIKSLNGQVAVTK